MALPDKIRQNRSMKIHCLIRSQFLPITPDVAWAFFSNPANLALLTPEWVNYRDESYEQAKQVYPGMVLMHRIQPYGLFPCQWVSVITHAQEPGYFIDEQKTGPFAFWQHKHAIQPVEGGVEIRDVIHYALPFGFIGNIGAFFVRLQIERLFDYREQMLTDFFGNA
jgi:ligand-binding SRPBCC domain-containing protein